MRVLLVDNYDSFTFNLSHYLGEVLGVEPEVVRNDAVSWEEVREGWDAFVISPGPGRPERESDTGVSLSILRQAQAPVLGVCLGHQALVHIGGGRIRHAPQPMHGRMSLVEHNHSALFANIPSPFEVVRYHSLIAEEPLPAGFRVTARTADGLIMAVEHEQRPCWGVQFHPESIRTEFGRQLIRNFCDLAHRHVARPLAVRSERHVSAKSPTPVARNEWQVHHRRIECAVAPEDAFVALYAPSSTAFWLDSSAIRTGYSRFTFMGECSSPGKHLDFHGVDGANGDSAFQTIRDGLNVALSGAEDLPFDFVGGWIGYVGYEFKSVTEVAGRHLSRQPDLRFHFVDRFIAFDHLRNAWYAVAVGPDSQSAHCEKWLDAIDARLRAVPIAPPLEPLATGEVVSFQLEADRETYLEQIARALTEIGDGETYEVCLTNRIRAALKLDPVSLYRTLRRVNPAPYAAMLKYEDFCVMSSSPERFLRLSPNGVVEAKPIKGTRPRGTTVEEDVVLATDLSRSEKDIAENLMIVDLLRNDLSRVCEMGSVWAPKLMQVESYATVHQLVSTIRGRLKTDHDAVDLLRATFPGGSMTGAPKRRTLEIIDELETSPRGIYSGALGYFSLNGSADLSIVIRTIVQHDGVIELGVGGAVVALSDPEDEFAEILVKARALMRAIAQCATGSADAYHLVGEPSVSGSPFADTEASLVGARH